MRIKKGQKDSEEEESIYEKEGKEGNNDVWKIYNNTEDKTEKKIQLKNTDENVVWSKIKKRYIKLVMSFCCFVSRSFTQLYYVK